MRLSTQTSVPAMCLRNVCCTQNDSISVYGTTWCGYCWNETNDMTHWWNATFHCYEKQCVVYGWQTKLRRSRWMTIVYEPYQWWEWPILLCAEDILSPGVLLWWELSIYRTMPTCCKTWNMIGFRVDALGVLSTRCSNGLLKRMLELGITRNDGALHSNRPRSTFSRKRLIYDFEKTFQCGSVWMNLHLCNAKVIVLHVICTLTL